MSEIIQFDNAGILHEEPDDIIIRDEQSLMGAASELLTDVRIDAIKNNSLSMPIAQLATLGAGVSSLLPAFRTVTQTTTIATDGLFRIVNAADGVLKMNKTGDFFWGAMKAADGTSKMVKLTAAGPIEATTTAVSTINPAVVLMAVALFSVEQKLGDIAAMEKQILASLEREKESEIEADLQTIGKIVVEYKYNWDNERYLASNHKMVLDIRRSARKNMISLQKAVTEVISAKKMAVVRSKVNSEKENLFKKFKYYRLSLFTFSMSALLEILLSGNFKEEYISDIINELETSAMEYRELFEKCSEYFERLGKATVEAKTLKTSGKIIDATGRLIEKIPLAEKGSVDEFLRDKGTKIQHNGEGIESEAVRQFAALSNPGIRVFIEKMDDILRINHTTDIYFDDEKIYLIAG